MNFPVPASSSRSTAASQEAMRRASTVLARGAASAVRLRTTAPTLVMASADGATVTDIDGNGYVDYVLGLGPVILGHRPPAVLESVRQSLETAVVFGGQHVAERQLGEQVVAALPSADVVSLVSTGSEAVHFAIRIARARTGRRRIVKFDGHYHGWLDPVFVNSPWMTPIAASPARATHAVAGQHADDDVTVVRWHDADDLERALAGDDAVAAVIMEPIPCNFGTLRPDDDYVQAVEDLCRHHGALLIFDEVLTGFRLALGGAQEVLDARPDLTIASKALASGFPIAVVAGTRDAMAPAIDGPVRPAGTYNGTPSSVAAARATLGELSARRDEIYPRLDRLGRALADGIRGAASEAGAPVSVNQIGSVLQLFWGLDRPVRTYADACRDDRRRVAELAGRLLDHGVHVPERGLLLLCAAHTEAHVDMTIDAFRVVLRDMAAGAPAPSAGQPPISATTRGES